MISQLGSAVSLASSTNPSLSGNSITLTAIVSSSVGIPTGQVMFLDGNTPLGSSTLAAGLATLTTSALAIGSHHVSASYSGDGDFVAAVSSAVTQVVLDFSLSATGAGFSGGGEDPTGTVSVASQTVTPGGAATFSIAITPTSGVTFPTASVLTVTGLPSGATATLNTAGWTQLHRRLVDPARLCRTDECFAEFSTARETAALSRKSGPLRGLPPVLWDSCCCLLPAEHAAPAVALSGLSPRCCCWRSLLFPSRG